MSEYVCDFCDKFSVNYDVRKRHPIFDYVIWEDDYFVVVPTLGCIVPGYVLIIPKSHHLGMATLPRHQIERLTELKEHIKKILAANFTTPIFFEHGPICNLQNRAGSCLDHAHLHCVPVDLDFTHLLKRRHSLSLLENYEDIVSQYRINQSYIYYENPSGKKYVFSDVNIPSQYLRRLIAEHIDLPMQWDWALSSFEDNAKMTVDTLSHQGVFAF